MIEERPLALVTGGNRGLGYATCQKLLELGCDIALTARDGAKALEAASNLKTEGASVEGFALDIADTASVREAIRAIYDRFLRIDILINNAGIYPEKSVHPEKGRPGMGLSPTPETILETLDTNTVGPYRVTQAVLPIMLGQGVGRIVNVSSQMARLSDMHAGSPGYRMSKTALNALTTVLATELADEPGIKVNSADPGWVKTDMGGEEADRSIDEGIDTIVWLALLDEDGPSGGFFRDRTQTDW